MVYDSMVTRTQSESIERLQSNALKTIWGWEKSYNACLDVAGVERLDERRSKAVLKFADKAKSNPRYSRWFPLNPEIQHDLRTREKYAVDFTRHERMRRAPIHAMRRRLNEQERMSQRGREPSS